MIPQNKSSRYRWVICALLFFAAAINFIIAGSAYLVALLLIHLLTPKLKPTTL